MRSRVAPLLLGASLAWGGTAAAEGPGAGGVDAHDAYARGTAAFRRGDYAAAAREYAAADALAPNPVALQAALDATVLGDDPVFGTTLLDRARGEPRTDALLATMLTAEKKFAHRTGRIRLQCPTAPCLGAIDGAAAVPGQSLVVRVGSHAVTLEGGGSVVERVVTVAPDETIVVAPGSSSPVDAPRPPQPASPVAAPRPSAAPPPPAGPAPAPSAGLSRGWFYASLGATAVAGGLAAGSGVDTASRHSAFEQTCGPVSSPACGGRASDGQSAQSRTNVLLGVTAGLGLVTVATALLVRWHGASVSAGVGRVSFDARF